MTWERIEPKRGGGGRAPIDYAVRLSSTKDKSLGRERLSIAISDPMMRKLKWKIGDSINLLIDRRENLIGIERSPSGSRIITHSGGAKGLRGKHGRVSVALEQKELRKFVLNEARYFGFDDIIVENDVLVIQGI